MRICSVCQQCYDDSMKICAVESHGSLTQAGSGDCLVVEGYRIDSRFESASPVALFKATHLASGKSVLIRFIAADDSAAGLEEHLSAVAGINHPNLARVFEFGKLAEGEFYAVLEDLPGQNLRDYLKTSSPLSERKAVRITRQIAEGLEELHAAGVVHRAVNPANIYLTKLDSFEVKLQNYDFGANMQTLVVKGATGVDAQTEALRYFSPEQFTDQEIDFKSDIYSLAVVFYEMLLGRSPYPSLNPQTISKYVFKEKDVEKLHFNLRALLAYTLRESLQHKLDMRPLTTNNFVRQLRHLELIATPSDPSLRDVSENQSRRKRPVNIASQTTEPPVLVAGAEVLKAEAMRVEPADEKNATKIAEIQIEFPEVNKSVREIIEPEKLKAVSVPESLPSTQVDDAHLQSIDPEEPNRGITADFREISEPPENTEYNQIDKIDPATSAESFEEIHITNENPDEKAEFDSIYYEDRQSFEEPAQNETAAARHINNTFAVYLHTNSFAAKKNFFYIAGILVLMAFGGLAAVIVPDWPSEASSSGVAPSVVSKDQGASPDKVKEVADMAKEGPDPQQIQGSEDNDTQKTVENGTPTPSGKALENNRLNSGNKEKSEKSKAKKTTSNTGSVNEQTTGNRERGKRESRKPENEKPKPTNNKTDGNTRPRIVPDARINN